MPAASRPSRIAARSASSSAAWRVPVGGQREVQVRPRSGPRICHRNGSYDWITSSLRYLHDTTSRIAFSHAARDVYRAIAALDASAPFEPRLRELVRIRASQINGCAYCVDMHSVDAQKAGEDDRRIFALAAWRESPFFDERERAALALTEAMTRLPEGGVPDDVYEAAAAAFGEAELGNLMGVIIAINAWNRVGVATELQPPELA